MLRRAPVGLTCLALALLVFTPGCKKGGEAQGEGEGEAAKPAAAIELQDTPEPDPGGSAPALEGSEAGADGADSAGGGGSAAGGGGSGVAGSGGGVGGGGGVPSIPREDLTCDPQVEGDCLAGEQCIGAQGCDAVWTCDADIVCKKDVREYCGCDGRTFETVFGNCPWQKYQYPGPCK